MAMAGHCGPVSTLRPDANRWQRVARLGACCVIHGRRTTDNTHCKTRYGILFHDGFGLEPFGKLALPLRSMEPFGKLALHLLHLESMDELSNLSISHLLQGLRGHGGWIVATRVNEEMGCETTCICNVRHVAKRYTSKYQGSWHFA